MTSPSYSIILYVSNCNAVKLEATFFHSQTCVEMPKTYYIIIIQFLALYKQFKRLLGLNMKNLFIE